MTKRHLWMKSHIYTFDIVLTFTEKRKTNNHRLPFTLLVFLHYKNQKRPTFVSGQQVTIWLHIFLNFAQENLNTRPKKFLHPPFDNGCYQTANFCGKLVHSTLSAGGVEQNWAKKRATKFFNSDCETQFVDTHFRSLFTAETAQEFYLTYSKMNVYHQFLSVN